MKKLLSVLLVVCIMMGICVTASADAADTYDLSNATKASYLTIASNKATCTSRFVSTDSSIKDITIVATLEKFSFLWFWDSLREWNITYYDTSSGTLVNEMKNLTSGTYRLKSVFTVKYKNGKKESVTVYSTEKKIA